MGQGASLRQGEGEAQAAQEVTTSAPTEDSEARAIIARLYSEVFDEPALREIMEGIKQLSRGYPVDHKCSECGKRQKVYVHVPDFKQILESMSEFLNQGYGRPGTAEGEPGGVTIIVKRNWPGDAPNADAGT